MRRTSIIGAGSALGLRFLRGAGFFGRPAAGRLGSAMAPSVQGPGQLRAGQGFEGQIVDDEPGQERQVGAAAQLEHDALAGVGGGRGPGEGLPQADRRDVGVGDVAQDVSSTTPAGVSTVTVNSSASVITSSVTWHS
jgi:hypothetical protein